MSPSTLLKRPSAFLPVAMSLLALAIVLVFLASHGPAPQADDALAPTDAAPAPTTKASKARKKPR